MNEEVKTGFWGYVAMISFIVLALVPIFIWFIPITNWIRIPLAVIGFLFDVGVIIVAVETTNSITSYERECNDYFNIEEDDKE